MDLRQWAEREGLKYFFDTTGEDEHGVVEMAYETQHCIECADIYVFRATQSRLLRMYGRVGDADTVVVISEEQLEGLTKASFGQPRHAVMADEDLMALAGKLIKHIRRWRNNPVEEARLAAGDMVDVLLMAAVSVGRTIGFPDEYLQDRMDDIMEDYGEPDPHTMQMARVQ